LAGSAKRGGGGGGGGDQCVVQPAGWVSVTLGEFQRTALSGRVRRCDLVVPTHRTHSWVQFLPRRVAETAQ